MKTNTLKIHPWGMATFFYLLTYCILKLKKIYVRIYKKWKNLIETLELLFLKKCLKKNKLGGESSRGGWVISMLIKC